MIPPLATLIGRTRIENMDPSTLSRLRYAVAEAVAIGYVMIFSAEMGGNVRGVRPDATQEKLWNMWVVRLQGIEVLKTIGLDDEFQKEVRAAAGSHFVARLREAGLYPKVRKRMRFQLLGQWYGQAGALLRTFHSSGDYEAVDKDFKQALNIWPFDDPRKA